MKRYACVQKENMRGLAALRLMALLVQALNFRESVPCFKGLSISLVVRTRTKYCKHVERELEQVVNIKRRRLVRRDASID